jgi:hypothetical protein
MKSSFRSAAVAADAAARVKKKMTERSNAGQNRFGVSILKPMGQDA